MELLCAFPDEMKRERDFYRRKGLPCPKGHTPGRPAAGVVCSQLKVSLSAGMLNDKDAKASSSKEDEADCHRSDEQVNILLESDSVQLKQMRRKFIRCSSQATITHLKKFIAKKLFNNLDRYKEVSPCLSGTPAPKAISTPVFKDPLNA